MAYSGDPSGSELDAVRFWLQDTGSPALLSDNELRYLMAAAADYAGSSPVLVASVACTAVKAKYAGRVSINADGVSISGDQLQQKYTELAQSLREEAIRLGGANPPQAGGLPDAPLFSIGQFDEPTSSQLTGDDIDNPPTGDPAVLSGWFG